MLLWCGGKSKWEISSVCLAIKKVEHNFFMLFELGIG